MRNVILLAELVGAGVADTQESVGKRNAGDGRSLMHISASSRAPADDRFLEVLEDCLDCLERGMVYSVAITDTYDSIA